ncbi:MAG: sodium:calcium antiporter [Rhizobiaceae bacterium]
MQHLFTNQSVLTNILIFLLFAAGIWFAGSRLTYLADAVTDRYKMAASTVGLVFLALATSLPEVVTTMTAASNQNAELVLNNLFGGIALQTAILAVADFWAKGAISNYPRKANHALEATLLVGLLAGLQVAFIMNEPISFMNVGLGSMVIACAYFGGIQLLRWYDGSSDWVPVDLPEADDALFERGILAIADKTSSTWLVIWGVTACLAILVFGILIVDISEVLADQTGLGSGFFGVTFLAAATSLPELSTTVTAVRMGAYTLAISNVFGSNLIMVVLIFPADILHTNGPILASAQGATHLAVASGVLVTTIYLIGLIVRRKPRVGRVGIDSFLVLSVYAISLFLYYYLK